jgi:hypothetical protein
MQLNVVQVNSSLFTHFPKTKSLVAEISDIGVRSFQPLYDDAADVGFALRNEKTGNVTRWALSETLRDPVEGEILGWKMIPTTESVRSNPQLEGYTIRLLND